MVIGVVRMDDVIAVDIERELQRIRVSQWEIAKELSELRNVLSEMLEYKKKCDKYD